MSTGKSILAALRQQLNLGEYRKKHWEGTFDEYLDIVRENPETTRTSYQRLYDMIISHGTEEVYENKEKIIRYKFFVDFAAQHEGAQHRHEGEREQQCTCEREHHGVARGAQDRVPGGRDPGHPVGEGHHALGDGPAAALVAVEGLVGEGSAEGVRVLDAGVHALAAGGRVDVRGVPGEERPPDAVRGLLSAYHRGVQRGRQQSSEESMATPESMTSGHPAPGGKEHDG